MLWRDVFGRTQYILVIVLGRFRDFSPVTSLPGPTATLGAAHVS
jgi:hypothetical protein